MRTPRIAPLPVERVTSQLRAFNSLGLGCRLQFYPVWHNLATESCWSSLLISAANYRSDKLSQCHERGTNNKMVKIEVIYFHFIPPGTSHIWGVWEWTVLSVNEAMQTLNDLRKLTNEILWKRWTRWTRVRWRAWYSTRVNLKHCRWTNSNGERCLVQTWRWRSFQRDLPKFWGTAKLPMIAFL